MAQKRTEAETMPAAEWVSVSSLRVWAKNPRKNDKAVDRVAASINRFGFGAPLLARRANGEIIAGHTRLKAALRLKIESVPVRYLDVSEADAHLLALADNKLGELAAWDDEMLAEVLADLKSESVDLGDSGFADAELAAIMAEDVAVGQVDADDIPKEPPPARTRPGDVWIMGNHRIICGDCRELAVVERLLDGAKVNVAFTSPPYASQRKYDESSGFKPIHPDKFVEWFADVQANVSRLLAADGSWFVNIKEHCDDGQRSLYVKDLTIAHVRAWNWSFIDELLWRRTGIPGENGNVRFRNDFEPIFHFTKRTGKNSIKCNPLAVGHASDSIRVYAPTNKNKNTQGNAHVEGEMSTGIARPGNVLDIPVNHENVGHSAMFPVALPEFFIKAFSDPGDIIFDPFMGSGTTLIAAERNGRVGYGVELSPAYCDIIVARWEAYTGQKATRDDGQLSESRQAEG